MKRTRLLTRSFLVRGGRANGAVAKPGKVRKKIVDWGQLIIKAEGVMGMEKPLRVDSRRG